MGIMQQKSNIFIMKFRKKILFQRKLSLYLRSEGMRNLCKPARSVSGRARRIIGPACPVRLKPAELEFRLRHPF
jgi:hypothetical protein